MPRLFGTVAGGGQYVFENIDRARLQGVEVEARAVLPAGWQLGPLELANESPLFTWAEAPRTWRATLRGKW